MRDNFKSISNQIYCEQSDGILFGFQLVLVVKQQEIMFIKATIWIQWNGDYERKNENETKGIEREKNKRNKQRQNIFVKFHSFHLRVHFYSYLCIVYKYFFPLLFIPCYLYFNFCHRSHSLRILHKLQLFIWNRFFSSLRVCVIFCVHDMNANMLYLYTYLDVCACDTTRKLIWKTGTY